tara:strand:+ start:23104 stop:23211 length:108 start_codon:yes stop_codon:yes gene_type:complete
MDGEVPEHECIDGIYKSESIVGCYNIPVFVRKSDK